ncbi:MAG: GNAT family N-acetyltransferase [Bacteroidota bacterium]
MENNESIKMTFPNKLNYSFMVQLFVREIAKMIGFSGDELEQIDIAIEESVSNIMIHASDEENPTFDIICMKIPDGIKITLKEMGIPFDPERIKKYELTKVLDDLSTSGLGIYLIQKVMDELTFHNLGPQGKETVMIKYLPDAAARKGMPEGAETRNAQVVITEKIDYEVRGLDEHEAIEVSRCAYKTHGYTFFDDHIYYPERLVEMNRKSEMISAVAVTKDNIFMGHGALLYQYPEDTIAELTFVFVNVEYRGQGALNKLVDYLFQVKKKRELRGIYAYAVTNHIFTQKSMIKFQINDCGILLATSPASWKFKGISDDASQRISVALGFRYMMPPFSYNLFVPEHHKEMVAKLYNNLGATHSYIVPSSDSFEFESPVAIINTGVNDLEGCAEIFIASYGADVRQQLRKILQGFCRQHTASINLFLKLKDPLTFWMTAEFEKMGFFFAGILPESRIGDVLVLQYLNNVSLDYSKILLVSDIAKELLTYIQAHDPNLID